MQKQRLLSIILIITIALFTTGCENKWPGNGDLDGMWQLMSIERDGHTESLKETKHYWSIRTRLVQFTEYGSTNRKYAHFERKNGKLILTDFCYDWGNSEANKNNEWIKSTPETERNILFPWGLYPVTDTNHPERLTQTFSIDHLDYDCLILSTAEYKIKLRKF